MADPRKQGLSARIVQSVLASMNDRWLGWVSVTIFAVACCLPFFSSVNLTVYLIVLSVLGVIYISFVIWRVASAMQRKGTEVSPEGE